MTINKTLKLAAVIPLSVGWTCAATVAFVQAEWNLHPDEVLNLSSMQPLGSYYEAEVPDTLNLAHRARLAINNLTRAPWDTVLSADALESVAGDSLLSRDTLESKLREAPAFINVKQLRTLPKLRCMCGSEQNLQAEFDAMQQQLRQIAAAVDGEDNDAKAAIRRMSVPITNWYHRDGNSVWLNWLAAIGEAVRETILQVEDRAFYPTSKEENQFVKYTPPDEPPIDQVGREGTVRWDQSWGLRALLRDYQYNGNEESLLLARKNLRFLLKPGMWQKTGRLDAPGNEHGLWEGHFHGGLTGLQAMLEMALLEDDAWLKQFVWEAYNHGRHNGVVRMGWFPMWFPAASFNREREQTSYCEACGIADLTVLAVKLSRAGLGDYWDDVDHYVRNQLIEQQFVSMEKMRRYAGADDRFNPLIERMVGGFGLCDPTVKGYCYTHWHPQVVTGCCSPNGALSIYYVWHSIVDFDQGLATVNLLLNRASPWLDVDSYLPYEGKVVLHNKEAHTLLVRIPSWVDFSSLRCDVNANVTRPLRSGQHVLIQKLDPGDKVVIEFDQPEYVDHYTIYDQRYTIRFRGSTIIDIQPDDLHPDKFPLYQRDHLTARRTPMRKVRRFVADRLVPLP